MVDDAIMSQAASLFEAFEKASNGRWPSFLDPIELGTEAGAKVVLQAPFPSVSLSSSPLQLEKPHDRQDQAQAQAPRASKVDTVNATADQICEQLIRVSPGKAAAVGAKLVAHLGPAAVDATMERLDEGRRSDLDQPRGAVGRRLLKPSSHGRRMSLFQLLHQRLHLGRPGLRGEDHVRLVGVRKDPGRRRST